MIVDGHAIAQKIYNELRLEITKFVQPPHLTVFTCAPNFETQKFLSIKMKHAADLGIRVNVIEFPESVTTSAITQSVARDTLDTDGVIIQLPFPKHIAIDEVLAAVPKEKDVDGIYYNGSEHALIQPVVGAFEAIIQHYGISLQDKHIVIVGKGRLVGQPAALWAKKHSAHVTVIAREDRDTTAKFARADVLILGVGIPGMLKPEMLRKGVIILDAGTSESAGALVGDADPACADAASLFTPVPGGVGPITVAVLLRNLIALARQRQKSL